LGLQLDIGQQALVRLLLGEVKQLESGLGARFEGTPELELLSQTLGLAQQLLGRALIVPETGLGNGGVQPG
jgi:hypothetical protein